MSRYEAILFDFDGTLVDSEPVHFECWREILAPYGIELEWETYVRECIGIADDVMLAKLGALAEPPIDIELLWEEYPRKKEIFRERMRNGSPVGEDVRSLLDSLDDYRMAVVSSSGRAEVEPVLEAASIRSYFDLLICREDVDRLKPCPDPYQKAARLLEITRALVVEDSAAGIASGKAAGFDVIEVRSPAEMPAALRAHLFL